MSSEWDRMSQLYQEALARDASQRPAFLDEACAGDDELRRALDVLLKRASSEDSPLNPSLASGARLEAGEEITTCEAEQDASPDDRDDPRLQTAVHALISKSSSPFASLGSDTVRSLLEATHVREYGPGEYLIRQGGPAGLPAGDTQRSRVGAGA